MNTCKTCKHWRNEGYGREDARFRTCKAPLIVRGYGPTEHLPDNAAQVENDEDDSELGIVTGPDFGCVLHEEVE